MLLSFPYSALLIDLPPLLQVPLLAFAEAIPPEDLAGPGRELNPHVTVLDGLHAEHPAEVRGLVEPERPLALRFGRTSVFRAEDSKREYDVVQVKVESDALVRLRHRLAAQLPHTPINPAYVPHATIAFVRPGVGARYEGWPILSGRGMLIDRLIFSTRAARRTPIPLRGKLRRTEGLAPARAVQPLPARTA